MTLFKNIALVALAITLGALLPACESEFAENHDRPRPTRAPINPTEYNSASNEVMGTGTGAVPIITVTLPNKKNESATVRTIIDEIRDFNDPPAASQPATSPASQPAPQTIHVDPISGQ